MTWPLNVSKAGGDLVCVNLVYLSRLLYRGPQGHQLYFNCYVLPSQNKVITITITITITPDEVTRQKGDSLGSKGLRRVP